MPSLPSFLEVKRRPDGGRQVFPCRLVAREGESVVLYYRLPAAWVVGGLRLEPGDDTLAYFWANRPYNVYHWLRLSGATAGIYFNTARDTAIFDDRVEWTDLGLDLLLVPDGPPRWVDEDDVRRLPAPDQVMVETIRRRLETEHSSVAAWVRRQSAAHRTVVGRP